MSSHTTLLHTQDVQGDTEQSLGVLLRLIEPFRPIVAQDKGQQC